MSEIISRVRRAAAWLQPSLSLSILGVAVEIRDVPRKVLPLVRQGFAAFAGDTRSHRPGRSLCYRFLPSREGYAILRQGEPAPFHAADPDDALFVLEKDITVQLQYIRKELYFFHAAALSYAGGTYMLAADSGRGKSTTTWALLHHGMGYLSDELSPVALDTIEVHPYPFALSLKRPPPPSHPLPSAVAAHAGRIHVPTRYLPAPIENRPCKLAGIFFVEYDPARSAPALRDASPGESAARLYVTALNALAHPNHGMDAVTRIVQHVPCYVLEAAELSATCRLVLDTLNFDTPGNRPPTPP